MSTAEHRRLSRSHRPLLVVAGVALIAMAVGIIYWPALHSGFILDDDLLLRNQLIKGPHGLSRIWFTTDAIDYWPISNSAFWLQWRLWGEQPLGYHLVNLSLHVAVALLIWRALAQLKIPGAYLAALLFAIHPVNVEAVAWISQLKTLLAALFALLSTYWFLKNLDNADKASSIVGADSVPRPDAQEMSARGFASCDRSYFLSILAFLAAMLSKGSAAPLPLVLLLITWWRRGRLQWGDLLHTVPFFLVAAILVPVNVWFQTHGSGEVFRAAGFVERIVTAGAIPWFYLSKAILPANLVFVYPRWSVDVHNSAWWMPLIATVFITVLLWWNRNTGWARPLFAAWIFYCVMLLPVLGLTDVSYMKWTLVADHYQNTPIIAIVALVAAFLACLYRQPQAISLAAATATLAILIVLSFCASRQTQQYADAETLWQATVAGNPTSPAARNYLGVALENNGQTAKAIEQFEEALKIDPQYSVAHNNLGNSLLRLNRPEEAIEHFKRSQEIISDYPEAYNNMAVALLAIGRPEDAIAQCEKALHYKPDFREAHNTLGNALLESSRPQEAAAHFRQAIDLDPSVAQQYFNLGLALIRSGQPDQALAAFEESITRKPDLAEAWASIAMIDAKLDRQRAARTAADRALELAQSQSNRQLVEKMRMLLATLPARPPELPDTAAPPP